MYCYKCGKQIPDDAKYCSWCGISISDEDKDHIEENHNMSYQSIEKETTTSIADVNQKFSIIKLRYIMELLAVFITSFFLNPFFSSMIFQVITYLLTFTLAVLFDLKHISESLEIIFYLINSLILYFSILIPFYFCKKIIISIHNGKIILLFSYIASTAYSIYLILNNHSKIQILNYALLIIYSLMIFYTLSIKEK